MEENARVLEIAGQQIRLIPEEDYRRAMKEEILPALAEMRVEEAVPVQGGILHAENYPREDFRGSIVVLHGYTESAEKLREMVWYFLQAGFQVFSYDHRGHGQSLRLVEDLSVTHVDHFEDYVEDLHTLVEKCVLPRSQGKPLYLFAHSMGGAVAGHYLIRHPDVFSRAVLSSPMIAPSAAPYPLWVGSQMAGFFCAIGKGKEMAFVGKPFDTASETLETSCDTSEARFSLYKERRAETDYLQNNSPTYRWINQAAVQRFSLLAGAGKIRARVLLCQAGKDNVVLLPAQDRFIARVPLGRKAEFPEAKHEIYYSEDTVFPDYVKTVLEFLTAK